MNVNAYLERIGITGSIYPNYPTLSRIQRQHMRTVPFENLDIAGSRKIILDVDVLYQKIVINHRGGYCYELNGLLHHLLRELGFSSAMVSGRVVNQEGIFGPEFDHMALLVDLATHRYIVDVGFGDSVFTPLPVSGEVVTDASGSYRIKRVDGSGRLLFQKATSSEWKTEYDFTLQPRTFLDFLEMNEYQQTSPESHFTQNSICSMATGNGRMTISGNRLIVTKGLEKEVQVIESDEVKTELLNRYFGISLS